MDDVLTLRAAAEQVGRAFARRQVRSGRWQSPFPRVVVTHNGPLTADQRSLAALLACPPGSFLGGWSALAFDGVRAPDAGRILVLIGKGARRPDLPGVEVTHSARLEDADANPLTAPPRTRPPRSLIDAAVRAASPVAARLVLIRGVQHGLTTPALLDDALDRRGQCRFLAVLRETVADMADGSRSLPEVRFAALIRRAGLPQPTRQHAVRARDGRYYLDAAWPEQRVVAEVDGIQHELAVQAEADRLRQNVLVVAGWKVLRFTSFDVRHRPDDVAAVLCQALLASVDLHT